MEREVNDLIDEAGNSRWEPDFRELVEGLGDAVYTLDLEGRFTWGNEAGLRYLGYDQSDFDEFLGRHFLDLLTPASKQVAIEHFSRGLAGEELSPFFEVQAYHRDGHILDFEIRASDLIHEGELIGRQGVVRNISAIKQLQAEMAETSKRLSQLEERERIMATLYSRFASLTAGASNEDQIVELQRALGTVAAQRLGLASGDVEILELLAAGKTNREIAELVHLSPHTIKDRVGRILRALGAQSRTEATAIAIRRGLVVPDPAGPPEPGVENPRMGFEGRDANHDA
ncbi:MAG: PAS domain S-box protein [Solirubrobacterales bacterium]|nr:PAS domain S-box protein [Solirubrobacterales bacterium]